MNARRFRRTHVAQQAVASGSLAAAELLVAALAARALGTEQFGVMATALAAATFVFAFVDIRLHEAVVALGAEFEAQGKHGQRTTLLRRLFVADIGTGVLGAVLVLCLLPLRPLLPESMNLGTVTVLLAAAVLLTKNGGTAVCRSYLRMSGRFGMLAGLTIAGAALRIAAIVPAAWGATMGDVAFTPNYMLLLLLGGNLASAAVLVVPTAYVAGVRDRLARGGERLGAQDTRRVLGFVRGSWLFSVSLAPLREMDVLILAAFAGEGVVGIYRLARTGITGADALLSPLHLVIYPHIAQLWHRTEHHALAMFLRKATVRLAAFGLVAAAIGILTAPIVLPWIGGDAYRPSAPLLQGMLAVLPLVAAMVWLIPLLTAAGYTHRTATANLAGGVASIALMLAFTPTALAWGPVIGYVGFNVVQNATALALALRLKPVNAVLRDMAGFGVRYD